MRHAIDHIRKFIAAQEVQLEQTRNSAAAHQKNADEAKANADAIKATIDELGRVLLGLKSQLSVPAAAVEPIAASAAKAPEARAADMAATTDKKAKAPK